MDNGAHFTINIFLVIPIMKIVCFFKQAGNILHTRMLPSVYNKNEQFSTKQALSLIWYVVNFDMICC